MSESDPRSAPIADLIRRFAGEFDKRFETMLLAGEGVPSELRSAVVYSALAPGKRLRPYLVVRSCELVGGDSEEAWPVAAAVECVHAFSLIHDDLPAMDNDDLRRGRPTCHKKFGEASAILAGDALILLAFELVTHYAQGTETVSDLVRELARGAGWLGMIGGQMLDLAGQSLPPDQCRVERIHSMKTARLFEAACRMGARAGRADAAHLSALGRFGHMVGCAFQIADDLLDVTSSTTALGKSVGKDAGLGKQSYPRCVGLEESEAAARRAVSEAVEALAKFGDDALDLRQLASYAVDRKY